MAKTKTAAAKAATSVKAAKIKASEEEITVDRRTPSDRRESTERRTKAEPVSEDRRSDGERRKTPRRRQIDPTTCERDYSDVEIEFMQAMDDYKRANGRMFPTCSEILEVLLSLGYEKVGVTSESTGDPAEVALDADLNSDLDDEASDETDLPWEQPPADEEEI